MKQHTKIMVQEIVAEGFKGFKEQKVITLADGKNTFIGENGKGKSSIGELITWVLTGKNIQGKHKDLNIINKESKVAMGKIIFKDELGEVHEIERKLSSTTTLKYDKKRITQKQLDDIIATELFLLIFNPLYFLSLDATNSRNAIYSLLPNITKEEVLEQLSAKERAILEAEFFDIQDTNQYLKNRRKEVDEIEDNKKYIEGYMAKLNEPIEIPAEQTFDNTKIESVEKQLELLNQRKPELKNLSELMVKKAEIEKSLALVKSERFESQTIKLELLNQKTLLEQQIKSEQSKEYKPVDTSKLETDVVLLRNDYKNTAGQNNALVAEEKALANKQVHFHEGEQCPSCKQVITKQAVEGLNNELKKQVEDEKAKILSKQEVFLKSLAELEQEGKKLVAEIQKAKKQDEELRKQFEEEKRSKLAKLQAELEKVLFQLNNLGKQEAQFKEQQLAKVNVLTRQIEALQLHVLEKENAQIQKAFNEQVQKERWDLQQTLTTLRKEKDAVLAHESKRHALMKRAEENNQELEKKNKELADYKKQVTALNKKISCMKKFNSQKIALLNETLSKHLTNISLRLEKTVQSTGEITDCFEILYMDKELKVCSTSETIKAGLEISNMIRELSGFDYPVFVDNGESVTSYEDKASQTIETKVVKGKSLAILKDGKEIEIASIPQGTATLIVNPPVDGMVVSA